MWSGGGRDRSRPAAKLGRYNLTDAREPSGGLARPPRSRNACTAVVAVPDPVQNPHVASRRQQRQLMTVNRRVDILEYERSRDLISEGAYLVGRIAQAIFERAAGLLGAGGQWREGDRVDAEVAKELKIIYAIEDARALRDHVAHIRDAIGRIDANIVRQVLGDRLTYADVARLRGRDGARGASYYAHRFRDALEDLAAARAARGRHH